MSVELPSPDTKYWTPNRKAAVVVAVREGLISLDEACRRYRMSAEEFLSWAQAIDKHGVFGLRATKVQLYKEMEKPKQPRHQ